MRGMSHVRSAIGYRTNSQLSRRSRSHDPTRQVPFLAHKGAPGAYSKGQRGASETIPGTVRSLLFPPRLLPCACLLCRSPPCPPHASVEMPSTFTNVSKPPNGSVDANERGGRRQNSVGHGLFSGGPSVVQGIKGWAISSRLILPRLQSIALVSQAKA
jgi:hypothetical protein